ncbi:DUF4157 domain-containing protein [Leptolyngbya sp. CCY15150]|uniref:eCIS core domain-containing protein n=1 Tax=Leptolyngbya sp. CCY15150 TaxID=2767772 RepID=UPI00195114E6|nr:DUF4157 domain-containing protein [Leptolyngbya sp. CCY15150]
MPLQRVQQSKSQSPQTLSRPSSQFAPRPFAVQESEDPEASEDLESPDFDHDRFEATGLQLKASSGTITPVEQERLGTLQAKMDGVWAQRMERAQAQPSFLDILSRGTQSAQPSESGTPVQAKLTVGQPNDQYEQEADQVAAQVMRMPDTDDEEDPDLQMQSAAPVEEDADEDTLHRQAIADTITPLVQRQTVDDGSEDEELQARLQGKTAQAPAVDNNFESQLSGQRGNGQPLPKPLKSSFENKFQAGFDHVRVHTDTASVQMSQAIGAQAFTHGNDIYFNSGKYNPGSSSGQELLAHELTHTIQQEGGDVQTKPNKLKTKLEGSGVQLRQDFPSQTEPATPSTQRSASTLSAESPAADSTPQSQGRGLTPEPTNRSAESHGTSDTEAATVAPASKSPQSANGNKAAGFTTSEVSPPAASVSAISSPQSASNGAATTAAAPATSETLSAETSSSISANPAFDQALMSTAISAAPEVAPKTLPQATSSSGITAFASALSSGIATQENDAIEGDAVDTNTVEEEIDEATIEQQIIEELGDTTTVEQQATEATAEMQSEIVSMNGERLPSLTDLIEPAPEGENFESIASPISPQSESHLLTGKDSFVSLDNRIEPTFATEWSSSSSKTPINDTASQLVDSKLQPDWDQGNQLSGDTFIQRDAEQTTDQNSTDGYDVEAARSAVKAIAGTIEISSEQARQSIQGQTETVSAALTANAAALSQVIQAQVTQNGASIREKFSAQRVQLQTLFQATRTQISTALEARNSEATTCGEQAKTNFTQLFADHRGQVETAVEDHVTAAEELRTNHEATARRRIADQANIARQGGKTKASGYPGDERGQAQAEAVRKVAEDTAKEIEGRESEIIDAIKECAGGIPKEFKEKGQEALQGFDQGLPDLLNGVDEQVQAVINKLTEQANQVYQQLDSLQEQQIAQLNASEAAAISRVQALEPQAQTQIQSGTQLALTALNASAQQAVGQICPFVTQASQTLQSIEVPDVEKANQYAQQVISFATGASSEVTGGMQEVSNGMTQQSNQTEVSVNQSLQQSEQQTNQLLQAITELNQTALSGLVVEVDAGFGHLIESLDIAFLEVETQIETKLSEALEELVQGFDQTLQAADLKVAEAVNKGLAKNGEALSQLDGKMQEAARDAAWRHDHPIQAKLKDIAGFVAGLVIGIVAVLALVVVVIVGFKVLIAGLVALGVSLLVAKIVAAVVGLGLLAYGIYQAYQARKEAGAEGGGGTFGMALLDLTGLTAIHRGVTQEGLSPFQRGLAVGEGVGTLASFFLARGMNKRISNRLPKSIANPIRGSFWQRFGGGRGNPKVPGSRPTGTARPGWGKNNTSDLPNNKQTPVTNKVSGAPPVDAGKQGKHMLGHPNNTSDKSQWRSGVDHVFETQNAWQKGQPVPGQSQARSYRPGYVVGTNGENSIKVHMDGQGLIHGVPHHRPPTALEGIANQGLNNLPVPLGASIFDNLNGSKQQE